MEELNTIDEILNWHSWWLKSCTRRLVVSPTAWQVNLCISHDYAPFRAPKRKNPHKTTLDDFRLAITNHTPLPKVDCNLSQLFNEYITSFGMVYHGSVENGCISNIRFPQEVSTKVPCFRTPPLFPCRPEKRWWWDECGTSWPPWLASIRCDLGICGVGNSHCSFVSIAVSCFPS